MQVFANMLYGLAMNIPEELVQRILTTVSDAIIAADRDGLIRFWNLGAERMFGYSTHLAEGQSLDLIIPERQQARHWDGYREVMSTGQRRCGQSDLLSVPSMRKDGTRISVEFTIIPLVDARGNMEGMAAIMRDVTKRHEGMRSLRQRLASATEPEK